MAIAPARYIVIKIQYAINKISQDRLVANKKSNTVVEMGHSKDEDTASTNIIKNRS